MTPSPSPSKPPGNGTYPSSCGDTYFAWWLLPDGKVYSLENAPHSEHKLHQFLTNAATFPGWYGVRVIKHGTKFSLRLNPPGIIGRVKLFGDAKLVYAQGSDPRATFSDQATFPALYGNIGLPPNIVVQGKVQHRLVVRNYDGGLAPVSMTRDGVRYRLLYGSLTFITYDLPAKFAFKTPHVKCSELSSDPGST